ncbi:hypothetical protein DY000_02039884 [Brassica cretica]|uniref:DUF4005 domain-containing protein n=1 Tax=Brassica cretica TaxID=69181 RepID=A0ABQ7BP56_BRACR|nr:hypothetical protein DY000_02039884 [Brassica cretica]
MQDHHRVPLAETKPYPPTTPQSESGRSQFELPEIFAGATSPTNRASLVPTVNRSSRPPSCSSRRGEAVDTNHAAIGARAKPLEPPEVSPLRGRETYAPSQSAGAAVHSGHSPPPPNTVRRSRRDRPPSIRRRESVAAGDLPVSRRHPPPSPTVTIAGDSPATRQLGRVDPVSQLGDSVNRLV